MRRSNYEPNEVRRLVENYVMLRETVGVSPRGLWSLVRRADLGLAFSRLEPGLRQSLFDHGVLGMPLREMDGDKQTELRRYEQALERLTTCLNGGH